MYTTFFIFKVPKTMGEIIKFFNDNLLDFYLGDEIEMKRISTLLTRVIYYGDKLSDVREEMLKGLEWLINDTIKDDFIKELYRFESEIMRISSGQYSEDTIVHSFDYDMLLYYQKLEKKEAKSRLIFTITDDKEVKIYEAK